MRTPTRYAPTTVRRNALGTAMAAAMSGCDGQSLPSTAKQMVNHVPTAPPTVNASGRSSRRRFVRLATRSSGSSNEPSRSRIPSVAIRMPTAPRGTPKRYWLFVAINEKATAAPTTNATSPRRSRGGLPIGRTGTSLEASLTVLAPAPFSDATRLRFASIGEGANSRRRSPALPPSAERVLRRGSPVIGALSCRLRFRRRALRCASRAAFGSVLGSDSLIGIRAGFAFLRSPS